MRMRPSLRARPPRASARALCLLWLALVALSPALLLPSTVSGSGGAFNYLSGQGSGAGPQQPTLWLIHSATPSPTCGQSGPGGQSYGPVGLAPLAPSNPVWNVAQWGIPCDLSTTTAPVAGGWSLSNGYTGQVSETLDSALGANAQVVTLAQNGAATLPTDPNAYFLPCAQEYDLLLQANSPAVYPTLTPNLLPLTNSPPPLSTFQTLTLSFGAQTLYEAVSPRCDLGSGGAQTPDFAYTMVGLVLTDTSVSPAQVLYYQIILHDSRCAGHADCSPLLTGEGDFFDHACNAGADVFADGALDSGGVLVYGVSETVASSEVRGVSGATCLTVGAPRQAYTLNLAPALTQWLTTGLAAQHPAVAPDATLAHWQITGLYLGAGVEGSVVETTALDSVTLTGA